jgi:hypothetical protein
MIVYIAAAFLLLGATMYTRGWIYTIWPDSKIAEKRKRRNLKVGFPTDMKLFGRKVRRLGFMILLVGGGMLGWQLTQEPVAEATAESAPAPVMP